MIGGGSLALDFGAGLGDFGLGTASKLLGLNFVLDRRSALVCLEPVFKTILLERMLVLKQRPGYSAYQRSF